jgi:hypothetical protein
MKSPLLTWWANRGFSFRHANIILKAEKHPSMLKLMVLPGTNVRLLREGRYQFLYNQGIIESRREIDNLILTEEGLKLYHKLAHQPETQTSVAHQSSSSKNMINVRKDPVQDPNDIDVDRDGLVITVRKMFHNWFNREQIAQQSLEDHTVDYEQNLMTYDEVMSRIATAEARVTQRLQDESRVIAPINTWSLDEQRFRNDKYWNAGPASFWLNPNIETPQGFDFMAPALPAPDWWTPKASTVEQIGEQNRQLLDQSLLPPPDIENQRLEAERLALQAKNDAQALVERTKANLIEARQDAEKKQAQLEHRRSIQAQLEEISQVYLYLGTENNGKVRGFTTETAAIAWFEKVAGTRSEKQIIFRRGSQGYGDRLELYFEQNPFGKNWRLDAILRDMEALESKIQTGHTKPSGNGFIMAQHGNTVRGFNNTTEAQRWIKGEIRKEIKDKLDLKNVSREELDQVADNYLIAQGTKGDQGNQLGVSRPVTLGYDDSEDFFE